MQRNSDTFVINDHAVLDDFVFELQCGQTLDRFEIVIIEVELVVAHRDYAIVTEDLLVLVKLLNAFCIDQVLACVLPEQNILINEK